MSVFDGFMPLRCLGFVFNDVQCYADPWAPPSVGLMWFPAMWGAALRPTAPFVIAHPIAWAKSGAENVADAYRPEGV